MYIILFQNVESLFKHPKDHPLSQPNGESVMELLCPFRARVRPRWTSMLPLNQAGAVVGKVRPHSDSVASTQDLKRPSLLVVLVAGTSSTTLMRLSMPVR